MRWNGCAANRLAGLAPCADGPARVTLWPMKLRTDLLEKLTPEMLKEGVVMNTHRYKPEPRLSKTGIGSLSSASTEERAKEVEHSMELIRKLEARAKKTGKKRKP